MPYHLAMGLSFIFFVLLGRLMGIEPTNIGATSRRVNHFATTAN
ncbi:Hypothetical Protein SLY_1053 [Strawberry lethal yellows phytoplasma (CPA) str. NZSb11]|uniref:Uncharacterized protein n=1 Tax=Strawberry lethal yellows phytoplasma (CPA) str. NZSb11 TaxID=980422 RepID=R4RYK4_PHYAS|nr:Hypothetical Protein SLY_1053 [Strawberry lethal yellows phytoplasma (CPA) str. NZSb11]